MRVTKSWNIESSVKRNYVGGVVLGKMDYLLSLQAVSIQVFLALESLEKTAISRILGIKFPNAKVSEARALVRLPSLRVIRYIRIVRMLSRLRTLTFTTTGSELLRSKRNMAILAEYGMIALPIRWELRTLLEPEAMEGTFNESQTMDNMELLDKIRLGNGRTSRMLPRMKLGLPPGLRSNLDPTENRRDLRWYFNRLPAQTASERQVLSTLKRILEVIVWKGTMEEEFEQALYSRNLRREGSQ